MLLPSLPSLLPARTHFTFRPPRVDLRVAACLDYLAASANRYGR